MTNIRETPNRYQLAIDRSFRRQTRLTWGKMGLIGLGVVFLISGVSMRQPTEARAASIFHFGVHSASDQLAQTQGQLDLANAQIERYKAVVGYSTQYKISADLATSIYDIAVAEGIEPNLAFRLVKVESDFNEHATSPVGAIGLTQMMPATAKFYVHDVTADKLYDRDTNLRAGFHYLRQLVRDNHGDLSLALLVYNRGEVAVAQSLERGENPSNGYERVVTRGYKGTGVTD